jgi:hypothetical protein
MYPLYLERGQIQAVSAVSVANWPQNSPFCICCIWNRAGYKADTMYLYVYPHGLYLSSRVPVSLLCVAWHTGGIQVGGSTTHADRLSDKTFSITLPDRYTQRDILTVAFPDGRAVEIIIPQGAAPGGQVGIRVPSQTQQKRAMPTPAGPIHAPPAGPAQHTLPANGEDGPREGDPGRVRRQSQHCWAGRYCWITHSVIW